MNPAKITRLQGPSADAISEFGRINQCLYSNEHFNGLLENDSRNCQLVLYLLQKAFRLSELNISQFESIFLDFKSSQYIYFFSIYLPTPNMEFQKTSSSDEIPLYKKLRNSSISIQF